MNNPIKDLVADYANLWNALEKLGLEVPRDEMHFADHELEGSGLILAKDGDEWKVQEHKDEIESDVPDKKMAEEPRRFIKKFTDPVAVPTGTPIESSVPVPTQPPVEITEDEVRKILEEYF